MTAKANEPGFWVKHVTGKNGVLGLATEKGIVDAAKQNMKWEVGNKGVAFARGAGVAAGVAMAGDALFRGKDADGNDRGLLARLGEAALGTGVAVGSAVVGRGRA